MRHSGITICSDLPPRRRAGKAIAQYDGMACLLVPPPKKSFLTLDFFSRAWQGDHILSHLITGAVVCQVAREAAAKSCLVLSCFFLENPAGGLLMAPAEAQVLST